jgi:hypothetical protein
MSYRSRRGVKVMFIDGVDIHEEGNLVVEGDLALQRHIHQDA